MMVMIKKLCMAYALPQRLRRFEYYISDSMAPGKLNRGPTGSEQRKGIRIFCRWYSSKAGQVFDRTIGKDGKMKELDGSRIPER
jgi:hypothetical protein